MASLIRTRLLRVAFWGAAVWVATSALRACGLLPKAASGNGPKGNQLRRILRLRVERDLTGNTWRDGWSN